MPARVQIEIEANDQASAILRGITSNFGSLGGAISDVDTLSKAQAKTAFLQAAALDAVAKKADNADDLIAELAKAEDEEHAASVRLTQTLASLAVEGLKKVADFLKDSIEVTQKYAQEVRDLSAITGTGAEETSRLLQVLDDYQLTAQDAEAATRKLTQNGLTPNLQTLAQLSDQYLAISDAQERNKFIIDNLGRSGLQWVNLLKQGSVALLEQGAAIDQNLILTEEQVAQQEQQRLALDALADSWQGVKVQVGLFLGQQVLSIQKTQEQGAALRELAEMSGDTVPQNLRFMTDEQKAVIAQMERGAAATDFYTRQLETHSEVVSELAEVDYKALISSVTNAQNEVERYSQTNEELTATQFSLQAEQRDLIAQLDELQKKGYRPTSNAVKDVTQKLDDVNDKLGENKARLKENEDAHKRWAAQTIFAFAQTRAAADGELTQGEGQALIALGVQLDLFDQKTADVMESVNEAFADLDTDMSQREIDALLKKLEALTKNPWNVVVTTTSTGAFQTTTPGQGGHGEQSGGEVYAGRPYIVGEAGAEPFFPSVNGRVLGHAEALHALSLGGGGGGTNYFYGNVTITADSMTGSDLMSWR